MKRESLDRFAFSSMNVSDRIIINSSFISRNTSANSTPKKLGEWFNRRRRSSDEPEGIHTKVFDSLRKSSININRDLSTRSFNTLVMHDEITKFVRYGRSMKYIKDDGNAIVRRRRCRNLTKFHSIIFNEFEEKREELNFVKQQNLISGEYNSFVRMFLDFKLVKLAFVIATILCLLIYPVEILSDFDFSGYSASYFLFVLMRVFIFAFLLFASVMACVLTCAFRKTYIWYELFQVLVFTFIFVIVSVKNVFVALQHGNICTALYDLFFFTSVLTILKNRLRLNLVILTVAAALSLIVPISYYSRTLFTLNYAPFGSAGECRFVVLDTFQTSGIPFPICLDVQVHMFVYIVGVFVISIYTLARTYVMDISARDLHFQNCQQRVIQKALEVNLKEQEHLLERIMPKSMLKSLREKTFVRFVTEYPLCVVLMTKMDDFFGRFWDTHNVDAQMLTEILSHNFSEFDRFINEREFEKLFTDDDTYVCVGGMDDRDLDEDELTHYIHSAIDLSEKILEVYYDYDSYGEGVRFDDQKPLGGVGIALGRVFVGVFGVKKILMNSFGEGLETAYLVCDEAVKRGAICVCEKTQEKIENDYEFVIRGSNGKDWFFVRERLPEIQSIPGEYQYQTNFRSCPSTPKYENPIRSLHSSRRSSHCSSLDEESDYLSTEGPSVFDPRKKFFLNAGKVSSIRSMHKFRKVNRFHKFFLFFYEPKTRRKFVTDLFLNSTRSLRTYFIVNTLCFVFLIFRVSFRSIHSLQSIYLYFSVASHCVLSVIYVIVHIISEKYTTKLFIFYFSHICGFVEVFLVLSASAFTFFDADMAKDNICVCVFFIAQAVFLFPLFMFVLKVFMSIVILLVFIIIPLIIYHVSMWRQIVYSFILALCLVIMGTVVTYITEKDRVKSFITKRKILTVMAVFMDEKRINEALLTTIFPNFVVNNIKDKLSVTQKVDGCVLVVYVKGLICEDPRDCMVSYQSLSEIITDCEDVVRHARNIYQVKSHSNFIAFASGFQETSIQNTRDEEYDLGGDRVVATTDMCLFAFEIKDRLTKICSEQRREGCAISFNIGIHQCHFVSAVIGLNGPSVAYDIIGAEMEMCKDLPKYYTEADYQILFLEDSELHRIIKASKGVKYQFAQSKKTFKGKHICLLRDYEITEDY